MEKGQCEVTDETIPDWARVEAVKRLNAEYNVRGVEGIHHKTPRDDKNVNIVVLARLIAKHEQPPEDPDLATAREAAAGIRNRFDEQGLARNIRAGRCDDQPSVQAALAAIKLHKERNP